MSNKVLWEILVPTHFNNSDELISVDIHKMWDRFCLKISGGMTIMKPGIGIWNDQREKMIPVRFTASEEDAIELANFTKKYYSQEAVMLCKIGEVFII